MYRSEVLFKPSPLSISFSYFGMRKTNLNYCRVVTKQQFSMSNLTLPIIMLKHRANCSLQTWVSWSHTTFIIAPTAAPAPAPGTWPEGTYGLMRASQGCPGMLDWHEGSRFYDTEDVLSGNKFSPDITSYLAGMSIYPVSMILELQTKQFGKKVIKHISFLNKK